MKTAFKEDTQLVVGKYYTGRDKLVLKACLVKEAEVDNLLKPKEPKKAASKLPSLFDPPS